MCTRILANLHTPIVVGRTMDWPVSTMPVLMVFPRGMQRHGGMVGDHVVISENPLLWTSQYASIVTTIFGVGTADGINERGLAGHLLYLANTDYGPRDATQRGLVASLWVQYALDCAATVSEALALLDTVQAVLMEANGTAGTVHFALEDATGDSAIVEYLHGEKHVYHNPRYTILTNDPPFTEQIALLEAQDFSTPASDLPLQGNVNPVARFQRAAYFAQVLPEPASDRQAVAGILAIARNVSVPFGAPYRSFGQYNTEYRTVCDLTNRRYYFELSTAPSVIWVDFAPLNLEAGAPVLRLDPDDIQLTGNVTAAFTPTQPPF